MAGDGAPKLASELSLLACLVEEGGKAVLSRSGAPHKASPRGWRQALLKEAQGSCSELFKWKLQTCSDLAAKHHVCLRPLAKQIAEAGVHSRVGSRPPLSGRSPRERVAISTAS